jgi:soluble lytic murein transglycosylase-like protein
MDADQIQGLIHLAKTTAVAHQLPPELVCAVVEQESNWDAYAIRYEPAFQQRYVEPLNLSPTETVARSISWGLMQLMGEVARELDYKGFLAELCDPVTGLEYGCRHLANKIKQAGGDNTRALLLWNGGGNPLYPGQVLARVSKYGTNNPSS